MYHGGERVLSLMALRMTSIFFLYRNRLTKFWIVIAARCWAAMGLDQGFWMIFL